MIDDNLETIHGIRFGGESRTLHDMNFRSTVNPREIMRTQPLLEGNFQILRFKVIGARGNTWLSFARCIAVDELCPASTLMTIRLVLGMLGYIMYYRRRGTCLILSTEIYGSTEFQLYPPYNV